MITMFAVLALAQAMTSPYDVAGYVSDVVRQKDGSYQMLVTRPEKQRPGKYEQAVVRVNAATLIVDKTGADARSYLRERLMVGVTFTGSVTKSNPPQATAKKMVVLFEIFDGTGIITNARSVDGGLHFSIVDAKGQAMAVATTGPDTLVQRMRDGKRVPALQSELKNGVRVEMSHKGPVMLSYPAQGKAGYVLIK